jgi:hypothetical protein
MHERWSRVFGSGGEMRKSMPQASSPHKTGEAIPTKLRVNHGAYFIVGYIGAKNENCFFMGVKNDK